MKGVVTICLVVLAVASVSAADVVEVGQMELAAYKFSYGGQDWYNGEVMVTISADEVLVKTPLATGFEEFDYDYDDEWWFESDDMSLAELQAAMDGEWKLRVITGGQMHEYTFNVSAVEDADFLPVPEITSPSWDDEIQRDHLFTWNNNGAHNDADGFMATLEVGYDWEKEDGWMADDSFGTLPQDAEKWFISDIPLGEAHFGVGYGVWKNLISDMDVPDGAPEMDYSSVLISVDGLQFTVVPEPMTLSIVGIGAVALLRRRR